MAKANTTWKVLPHGPIEKLGPRLWRVEGALDGMPLKRVMTVVKRADGTLLVHNAMALDAAAMEEFDAMGPIAAIVVPNGYHRLDAPAFKQRYPTAKFYCPSGARAKVEEVVPVDGDYAALGDDGVVRAETLDGTREAEGVLVVRDADGATLVFNDVVFNMPHAPGFSGFVLRYLTASSGGPRVSRVARLFVVKDAAALRAHFERLAAIPGLVRAIVSHHETITGEVDQALRALAATL
jgi:hypothetical protein